jgi:RND family efflux transporter MFP subunit
MKGPRFRLLAMIATLLLAAACEPGITQSQAVPPTVNVVIPQVREIVEWDEYIGRLESPQSVEVRARVSGYLEAVHFHDGKDVKKGDRLFTIDPRPYQAEYDRAAADFARAQAQAEIAENDAQRAQRLMTGKTISVEEYETRTKNASAARAATQSAAATLELAKLNLAYTDIRAPIDGRVGRALITEGNLISGGMVATTLLTTIVSLDPLYLYGDADERAFLKYMRLAQAGTRTSARDAEIPAEMALADEQGFPHRGYMDFVDNRIDPSTGTFTARSVFANRDRRLSPGLFARTRIPGSAPYQAMLLPDRAIAADQDQKYVYVVDAQDTVQYRPVQVGPLHEGLRIVRAGLEAQERVIVEGQLRVRPGVTVIPNVLEPVTPSTDAIEMP